MIKVNENMLNRFLEIMEDYNEFVYGELEDIKRQLEMCLNTQGYWSGCSIRVYYDKDKEDFRLGYRY